jgi:hypothetical protein
MITFTEFQLTWSTADEARRIFSGERGAPGTAPQPLPQLPPGNYRVIDGQLVRIVPGTPIKL